MSSYVVPLNKFHARPYIHSIELLGGVIDNKHINNATWILEMSLYTIYCGECFREDVWVYLMRELKTIKVVRYIGLKREMKTYPIHSYMIEQIPNKITPYTRRKIAKIVRNVLGWH